MHEFTRNSIAFIGSVSSESHSTNVCAQTQAERSGNKQSKHTKHPIGLSFPPWYLKPMSNFPLPISKLISPMRRQGPTHELARDAAWPCLCYACRCLRSMALGRSCLWLMRTLPLRSFCTLLSSLLYEQCIYLLTQSSPLHEEYLTSMHEEHLTSISYQ